MPFLVFVLYFIQYMISYLSGKIIAQKDGWLIVEVNGVGYEVFVSQKTSEGLPQVGEALAIFCSLEANERGVKLFGFATADELELFKIIRDIQGVGPKAALEISSIGSLDKVKTSMDKSSDFLADIPGIGPKKAQKIILELSGKVKMLKASSKKQKDPLETDPAFLALQKLGFKTDEIKTALTDLPSGLDVQERIKQTLKQLGR